MEQGAWTNRQRQYGKAFKKPTSQRSSAEKTYAGKTTERRVALLDGPRQCLGLKESYLQIDLVGQRITRPMPKSSTNGVTTK